MKDRKFVTLVEWHTHNGQKYPPGKVFAVGPAEDVLPGTAEWMVRQGVAKWGKDAVPQTMIAQAIANKPFDPADSDRSHAPRGNADPTAPAVGNEVVDAPTLERGSDQTTNDLETPGETL